MTSVEPTQSVVVPNTARYAAWYIPTRDGRQMLAKGRPPIILSPIETQPTVGVVPLLFTAVTKVTPPVVVVDPEDPPADEPFIYGTTRPTRFNTGAYDYDAMTTWTGTATFTGIGTEANPIIVRDKWFTTKVSVSGRWYRFINCHFSGGFTINETPFQATNTNARNNVAYRCTIWPQNPRSDTPACRGHHLLYDRCYVRNCTDGMAHIGVDSSGGSGGSYTGVDQQLSARGSLFELGIYRSPDYGGAGKLPDNASHLDLGGQIRGGVGFDYFGCAFYGFIDPTFGEGGKASVDMPLSGTHVTGRRVSHTGLYTLSIFMFSPKLGDLSQFRCDSCWLDGATQMFVFADHIVGAAVTNNRFGRLHRDGGVGLVSVKVPSGDVGIIVAGNHYWYELGPYGEKWPYNQQPDTAQGESMPSAAKIAQWTAAGIKADDELTWPSANTRSRG